MRENCKPRLHYLTGETDDPDSELPDIDLTYEERKLLDLFSRISGTQRSVVHALLETMVDGGESGGSVHSPQMKFRGDGK